MLQTNPEIRSVAYNRLARDEEVRQARAGYFPSLDVEAGYGYQDIQEPYEDELDPKQVRLTLRQNVFRGLATMNEIDRQEARVLSAAFQLQATSEHVALRGARVYLNTLRSEELVMLAEQNLATHLRISDQIKLRSDSGVASKADSDQVAGRVSLAQSNVIIAKTNLLDVKSNYLSIVGHMPVALVKPGTVEHLLPATIEEAERLAIENHPTLKSATADLVAREEQAAVAKAPYLPVIDLELDQQWDEDLDLDGKDYQTLAMVRMRFNLFRGFRDQARKAETVHLINEAREIRNSTNRQVIESIRLSWMSYQAVLERIDYLENRVVETSDTALAYTKQFNLGKRSLLDVLDSEAEVINAKRDLLNAQFDGLNSQFRILNGLGRLVSSLQGEWPVESIISEKDEEINIHINDQVETVEKFNQDSFVRPEPQNEN
jgi:adhesin transport system outer membrane protein